MSLEQYFVYRHIAGTTASFTVQLQLLLLGYAVLSVLQALPQAACLTISIASKLQLTLECRGIQREKTKKKKKKKELEHVRNYYS